MSSSVLSLETRDPVRSWVSGTILIQITFARLQARRVQLSLAALLQTSGSYRVKNEGVWDW